MINHIGDEDSVNSIVQKFWELASLPNEGKIMFTEEQRKCGEHFCKSMHQLKSGRFEVSLPFKSAPSNLGLSYETAKRRFLTLECRLLKDPITREMYKDFMKEYLNLGHMSATNNEIPISPHYFIPHQVVLRPQRTSTKHRIVVVKRPFNGGPTIQEELYSTLIRF